MSGVILKIIGIGICGVVLLTLVKQYKPEFAVLTAVLVSIGIISLFIPYLTAMISAFENIADRAGIELYHIKTVIKIIGVAYVCQFASDICKDAGENSVAGKIELGGKVMIITLSMPIIYGLTELITKIINY